jgi:hypothetical protein
MNTHMRENKLKEEEEEEEEEEIKQREEAFKKWEDELRIWKKQLEKRKKICCIISLHAVGSTFCVIILINMCCIPISVCCNSSLFYVSYFKFLCKFSQIYCPHNEF